ncbi:MAG: AMP-binding protein [candidate division Zixibacteria bacterium]|nr:AMP-binding protein [candidate division Zixibacteria bacterium]
MAPGIKLEAARRISIADAFHQAALRHSHRIALKADGGRGREYTYGEVDALVGRLAAGLAAGGYLSKREIGLLSENRPEWGITYLAVQRAGGTVVPIDPGLKESEIDYIIEHAGLRVVFCSESCEKLLKGAGSDLTVISFGADSLHPWRSVMSVDSAPAGPAGDDVAVLIYTSGTTGAPKAVELTHRNILANFEGIDDAFAFDHNDTFLSVLPLHHTFEATCGFITPLLSGATVVYGRSLKSKDIKEDIGHNGVTVMCGVPLLFEKLYHSVRRKISSASLVRRVTFNVLYHISAIGWRFNLTPGRRLFAGMRRQAGLETVRIFVSGGAPLPPNIAAFFNYIGFNFFQGYGLTECSPVVSTNRFGSMEFGSVGPPLRNVELKILEPDFEGIGEIVLKAESVTPGYRNNREGTAELIRDGWLHTGDMGRFRRGHLWITGRKKNVIISAAGKNIHPEELEEKLLDSALIMEAVVFGRKKESKQGEEVRAVIVPDWEQMRSDCAISRDNPDWNRVYAVIGEEIKRLNAAVAEYKRITAFDVQLEELDKTSTKKVRRSLYR